MGDTLFPAMDKEFAPAPKPCSPLAAATDPVTSHMAAGELVESGTWSAQCQEVLEALRRFGPRITSAELAARSGLDRFKCGRRLPDLESAGKAKRDGQHRCLVGGKMAVEWSACK